MFLKALYRSLFFGNRFYLALGVNVLLFIVSFFYPALYTIALLVFAALMALLLLDLTLLFITRGNALELTRITPVRFSNGDENEVRIEVRSNFRFPVSVAIVDELPFQFQLRDHLLKSWIKPGAEQVFTFSLRPLERGIYQFGNTNAFVSSPFGLVKRRFIYENEAQVKTYPSFLQLRNFELLSYMNRLNELGVHKKRTVGHSMEFDHIKEYTRGDDVRMLNWKATARRENLMVNTYVEERSQQVYCVIDKGRTMKMPFDGLTLLDYAINSTLIFSNVALQKGDKAGLATIAAQQVDILPASNKKTQLDKVLEMLYAQETQWEESDYEKLSISLRRAFNQRSLLILFTNFESMPGLQRQLPYLRKLARYHLLLVVFFENTALKKVTEQQASGVEEIYKQVIAQQFAYEKKLIARELSQYGIMSLLVTPQQLTIQVINKYLELKARMLI
ncbi:DUF58 domain-containing protein [uncultured Chitinophaga sp.]|jgi:Uncharacterized conserved protein (some members contain a von Willebrand factor type A (vWA) domain)|uniref:DUF58 domain-containing protein n=1 Tax=uncultured Chitinophaga sp. TaxID=339340 RepID=UPI0026071CA8|nr:DUF58 domain-containing protein [uncultured Chitinophaga sp.]